MNIIIMSATHTDTSKNSNCLQIGVGENELNLTPLEKNFKVLLILLFHLHFSGVPYSDSGQRSFRPLLSSRRMSCKMLHEKKTTRTFTGKQSWLYTRLKGVNMKLTVKATNESLQPS